jgi:predicted transcriptional regulator
VSDEQPTVTDQSENNGDMPPDHVAASVAYLIEQSRDLRERRDALRAERQAIKDQLDAVGVELARYDKAVRALTGVPQNAPRAQTEQKKVKAHKQAQGTHPIANAMKGYPGVSEAKQSEVYTALQSIGRPIGVSEFAQESGLNKSMVSNALAHLRARGLVRWAGAKGSGHLYAIFDEGDK